MVISQLFTLLYLNKQIKGLAQIRTKKKSIEERVFINSSLGGKLTCHCYLKKFFSTQHSGRGEGGGGRGGGGEEEEEEGEEGEGGG